MNAPSQTLPPFAQLLAMLACALPAVGQNVGLVVELPTSPPQAVGQTCGAHRCQGPFGPPLDTVAIAPGARGRFVVHGAQNGWFFLAAADTIACQSIPGIASPLILGGTVSSIRFGILTAPPIPNVCGGNTSREGTWLTVPLGIPLGTSIPVQGIALDTSAGGTIPRFTNPVVVVVN